MSGAPSVSAAELVRLRFFVGLTQEHAAKELRVSCRADVGIRTRLALLRDCPPPKLSAAWSGGAGNINGPFFPRIPH
jgi:hypothetical protein